MLRAGSASADITPESELPHYYGGKMRPATGCELNVHAICFECGDTRGALVSIDATFVDRALVLVMRERAELASGIPGPNICIATTHSHATPALGFSFLAGSPPVPLYQDLVVQRVAEAVTSAANKMTEAILYAGHCPTPGIEFCRRMIRPDGQAVMHRAAGVFDGWAPEGNTDREMQWAIFETTSGEPLAAIINWPIHNNACSSPHYHPDLFGRAGDALRSRLGEEIATVTLAAPCGDITWINPDEPEPPRGEELAQRAGTTVAENIIASRATTEPIEVNSLRIARDVRTIPDRPYEQSTWCEDGCRGSSERALAFARSRYDPEREAVRERGNTEWTVEVQGIRLGELAIITNPAELFCEFGMQIKRESPFDLTMPVEMANGACGYVPYQRSFKHGGYETHRTCWTSHLIPEAGDIITERSLTMLHALRR